MRSALSLMVLFAACSVSEHDARTCDAVTPCAAGETCFRGFCVSEGGGDAAFDGALDAALDVPIDGQVLCTEDEEGCYDGPYVEGRIVGRCRTGTAFCVDGVLGECIGEQLPREERCNGVDDDCDGETDEIAALACDSGMLGACQAGQLACLPGGGERCIATLTPVAEVPCNRVDEDCDGQVDEFEDPSCYPADTDGCDGGPPCTGRCVAGEKRCVDDVVDCMGATLPATEDGSLPTCDGADNDCDGEIDEGCSCTPGTMESCYSGPVGTLDVGVCRSGMRTCLETAAWGACDDVVPGAEDCTNVGDDDDCDGTTDENLGVDCASGEPGNCATGTVTCPSGVETCLAPDPVDELCNNQDDDCDGDTDEGFDLGTDEENCGVCGMACSGSNDTCCDSVCVNTRNDSDNCGVCGRECFLGCLESLCL